ncbi:MAG: hypothetical protein ACYDHH_08015 [Solirubrobacteraceae bacterium]
MSDPQPQSPDPLRALVYAGDGYKEFGAFTVADVHGRADELKAVTGWGPTVRVGAIARGWSELARAMTNAGAETVADLDVTQAAEFARKVWATPPDLL